MVQKEEEEQTEENEGKNSEVKLEDSTTSEDSEFTGESKNGTELPGDKLESSAEKEKDEKQGSEKLRTASQSAGQVEVNDLGAGGSNACDKNENLEAASDDDDNQPSGRSNKNIAPSLQQTAHELEKQLTRNSVGHLLDDRPTIEELQRQGIHHGNKISPSLQGTAETLERKIHTDQISHKLKNRPSLEHVQEHIFPHRNVAPSLQPVRAQLQRKLSAEGLNRSLQARPSLDELKQKGILCVGAEKTSEDEIITRRARFAIALKGAARLEISNKISTEAKGKLKDLILREDKRVMAAVEAFEMDKDVEEMLDTFCAISKMA